MISSVTPITAGYSQAANYLMKGGEENYILRIENEHSEKFAKRALFAAKEAAKAGIGPQILWSSSDGRIVIIEFIKGGTLSIQDAKKHIQKIAETLRKAHALPRNPYERRFNYIERFKKLYNPKYKNNVRAVELLNELQFEEGPKVPIHGDLNPRNIFLNKNGVFIIDWDETNFGDPFFDLTLFTLLHDYNAQEELIFLEVYLQHPPTDDEIKRFECAKNINLAGFVLSLNYLTEHLNQEIDPSAPFNQEWSYYVNLFAEGDRLPAQFFYDWGRMCNKRLESSNLASPS